MLKIVVVTACFLASACLANVELPESVVRDWDCDSCSKFYEDLLANALSDDSLAFQIAAFQGICEGDPACLEVAPAFWTQIANLLWPFLLDNDANCAALECPPEKTLLPKESCADCMWAMEQWVFYLLSTQGQVNVDVFLDENFCPNQEFLTPEECMGVIPDVIGYAFNAFYGDVEGNIEGQFSFCLNISIKCIKCIANNIRNYSHALL